MDKYTATNRIIAEFMGFIFYDDQGKYYHIEEGYYLCEPDELKYHSDWNWLMSVVDKIEKIKDPNNILELYEVKMRCSTCEIVEHPQWRIANRSNEDTLMPEIYHTGLNRFEATYDAILDFIKWFNKELIKWFDKQHKK
jgi:hypothetical protein